MSATWQTVLEQALRAADAAPVVDPGFTGTPGEFLTWAGRMLGAEVESDAHLRGLLADRRARAGAAIRRAAENSTSIIDSMCAGGMRSLAERPAVVPGLVPLHGLQVGFSGAWRLAWANSDAPPEHPIHKLPAGARVRLSVANPYGQVAVDAVIVARPGQPAPAWVTATGCEKLAAEFAAERDARDRAEAERREAERVRAAELSRPLAGADLERLRHELAAAKGA